MARRRHSSLVVCFALAALAACQDSTGADYREHKLAVAGVKGVVVAGKGGKTNGDTLTLKHGDEFTLFSSYQGDWDPKNIVQLKLLGKIVNFTVDLSKVGCACNLAFYLIAMPALDWDGKPSAGTDRGGQPPYYCDANQVGGQWCPEMDIMEANTAAFQSTPHKCDAPTNGHFSNCDRGGCDASTRDIEKAYGPDDTYTIDTRRPFQVSTHFPQKDGVLSGVRTVLLQSGKRVVLDHAKCSGDYLNAMGMALASGMSLRITYWGDQPETMAWMDAPPCERQTCGQTGGSAVISGISIGELPAGSDEGPELLDVPSVPSKKQDENAEYTAHKIDIVGVSPAVLAGRGGETDGNALTMNHGDEFTLFSSYSKKWDPDNIAQLKLLGKMLNFTVDLSKVGCACNLAFYLISMPALDWDGKPSAGTDRGGQPPYYCDANMVGNQWCPEMDIMEANTHAFQSTPHKCDPAVNGHFSNCDRGGCGDNTRDTENAYGPGESYTIDTRQPFLVSTHFPQKDGVLAGMRTVLHQSGKRVVLDHSKCWGDYLSTMSPAMAAGMSLRITYWGDQAETMAWMDAPPCERQTCGKGTAGAAVISSISIGDLPVESAAPPAEEKREDAKVDEDAGYKGHAIVIHGVSSAVLAGRGGHIEEDTLTISHGNEFTLFSTFKGVWAPENIVQLKLLGKSLMFSVDLSKVGCSCNLAFYLIATPALDWNGAFSPGTDRGGQPPYYCDANQVGGQWCPEIDLMEANNAVFQSTPHKCDSPVNGHYGNCDRGGCDQNTREMESAYGPGESNTINTKLPFNVTTDFFDTAGVLSGIRTTLAQGSKRVTLDHSKCDQAYLQSLSDVVAQGMSLRITYWGDEPSTMAWMDMPPCGPEPCRGGNAGAGVISAISVGPLQTSKLDDAGEARSWAHFMQKSEQATPVLANLGLVTLVLAGAAASLTVIAIGACFALRRRRPSVNSARRLKSSASMQSLASLPDMLATCTGEAEAPVTLTAVVTTVTPQEGMSKGGVSLTQREGGVSLTQREGALGSKAAAGLRRASSSCQRLLSHFDKELSERLYDDSVP